MTYNELLEACFEELIVHADSTRVFDRRQRVLDHELNIYVNVNLLQRNAHWSGLGICKHHEFDVGRSFVVMKLVLRGTIGKEAVSCRQPRTTSEL